jgi:RHS repeat-associated protein
VITGGTPYYYVQDRLGSVTALVSSTGTVASQYSYDPHGNQTTVSGTLISDIGYAGYFYHAASGLDFALHRAYDPAHARWLNRERRAASISTPMSEGIRSVDAIRSDGAATHLIHH